MSKKVLIIGDSNVGRFFTNGLIKRLRKKRKLEGRVEYTRIMIGKGKTCQGLRLDPPSESVELFREGIAKRNLEEFDAIAFCIGSLDCDTTVWHRKKKYNTSMEEQLDFAINTFGKFLKEEVEKHFPKEKIVLMPVLSQFVEDYSKLDAKGVHLRAENNVGVTLQDRIKCTRRFNRKLKELANKNGYQTFGVVAKTANKDGTLKKEYLPKDFNDCHGHEKVGLVYEEKLLDILNLYK